METQGETFFTILTSGPAAWLGEGLTNMDADKGYIVNMEFTEDSQVLAITLNGDAIKFNEASKTNKLAKAYKFDSKVEIETLTVKKASEVLTTDANGNLVASADVDVVAFYVNDEGKAAALPLDDNGMPAGLKTDAGGKILGIVPIGQPLTAKAKDRFDVR